MKVSEQCGIAASKGKQTLGLNRRNIENKEKITNNTAVQNNCYTSFRILYIRVEVISYIRMQAIL